MLNKTCVDPFLTTNLGQALQNADANTIILMGLWTNYVVEATARHASDMGYRVFLVREACASNTLENHEFTLNKILPTICYVVSVKDARRAEIKGGSACSVRKNQSIRDCARGTAKSIWGALSRPRERLSRGLFGLGSCRSNATSREHFLAQIDRPIESRCRRL